MMHTPIAHAYACNLNDKYNNNAFSCMQLTYFLTLDCIVTAVYTIDDWKTVHNKNGVFLKDKNDKSIYR